MFHCKLGVDFFSASVMLHPHMEHTLRLIRAWPSFSLLNENTYVSLGLVGCLLYTRRIALKDGFQNLKRDMLAYTPIELEYIIPARKNEWLKKTHLRLLQLDKLLVHKLQILHLVGGTLKIHSVINKSTSDKQENKSEDNQL